MARLTPRFAASRTVREYTEEHYLPAARAYRIRAADKGAAARRLIGWRNGLAQQWAALRFGAVTAETKGQEHIIEAEVFLKDASPEAVLVQLYADGEKAGSPVCQEMTRVRQLAAGAGGYAYRASVPSSRPVTDYTARIIPQHGGVPVPLEAAPILWQR